MGDLKGFAAALEESPLSICVNAGVWNSYTGGVMSSAACGPMGAAYQDHCVMAVGFNTTASTPYWIVGPPRGVTRATFTWKWLKILVGWQTMQPSQPLKWTFLRPRLPRQLFVAKQCISELRGTNSRRWLSDVDIASSHSGASAQFRARIVAGCVSFEFSISVQVLLALSFQIFGAQR